jgi:hypothetical protein
MSYTDRFNAAEASTVRLYFRNYNGNILTDTAVSSVQLRAKNSSVVLQSVNGVSIVHESTGVYYIDWAIPSSLQGSLKYSATFPGAGDYQDVWAYTGPTTLAQDFYVYQEGYPTSLAEVVEPIRLTHDLSTNRFEAGASDFLMWRITEANGRLIPGETLYPEGDMQIFFGNKVIKNYLPFIHRADREIYKYYLNTTSFKEGVYKVQARFVIPPGTVETQATIQSSKSLLNGFSPNTNEYLYLTVDGIDRTISYPKTATVASTSASLRGTFSFVAAANDLFIIAVDGSEKRIRLLNTDTARTDADIVAELNGTVHGEYIATFVFPIVTSSIKFAPAVDPGVVGLTFSFSVDSVPYTVQFSSLAITVPLVVAQLNVAYPGIAFDNNGIITLGNAIAPGTISDITILGGSSLPTLGFTQGQNDTSTHSISPAVAALNAGNIEITGVASGAGEIRILKGTEGSVANASLGFPSNGDDDVGASNLPATNTGSGITYPILVSSPTTAEIESTSNLSTFSPTLSTVLPATPTSIDTLTFTATVDGVAKPVVTFNDVKIPAAITSAYSLGSFSGLHLLTLILNDGTAPDCTVTFSGNPLTLSEVVSQINAITNPDAIDAIADVWNGRLRLRRTTTTLGLTIKTASTAKDILGFEQSMITSPAEEIYQNDQVYFLVDLIAPPYILPWTLNDIINKINTVTVTTIASLNGSKIVITSPTTGIGSTLGLVGSGTLLAQFLLAASSTGANGTNHLLQLEYETPVVTLFDVITLTAGVKSLADIIAEINTQTTSAVATTSGTQIKISTVSTGTTAYLKITDGTFGLLAALGLSALASNGTNATAPVLTGTAAPLLQYASGGHAILYLKWTDGTTTFFSSVDISADLSLTDVRDTINADATINPYLIASVSGTTLTIQTLSSGASYVLTVGGLNEGSTANAILGFSSDGVRVTGTNGQPLSLTQIVERINAAYGGNTIADSFSNLLRLRSTTSGAGASIIIGDDTTTNLLDTFGLAKGTYYGTTTTQVSQTIVSPKLSLIIGTD